MALAVCCARFAAQGLGRAPGFAQTFAAQCEAGQSAIKYFFWIVNPAVAHQGQSGGAVRR